MEVKCDVEITLVRDAAAAVRVQQVEPCACSAWARASVGINDRNWIYEPIVAASGIGRIARDLHILRLWLVDGCPRGRHVETVVRGTGGWREADDHHTWE